jgi:hypothetical protein
MSQRRGMQELNSQAVAYGRKKQMARLGHCVTCTKGELIKEEEY